MEYYELLNIVDAGWELERKLNSTSDEDEGSNMVNVPLEDIDTLM